MSRLQRIRQASATFNQPKTPSRLSASSLVLTNSVIYTALADYVINYRIATWRYDKSISLDVAETFSNKYLPIIIAETQRRKLFADEIVATKALIKQLMKNLVSDAEHNSKCATAYLVYFHQGVSTFNFLTHESPISQMRSLQIEGSHANWEKGRKNKPTLWKMFVDPMQSLKKESSILKENENIFIEHMPENCSFKNKLHSFSHAIILMIFSYAILYFLGQLRFEYTVHIKVLFVMCAAVIVDKLSQHLFDYSVLLRNPFCFTNMDKTLQSGLLSEIADALDSIRRPQKIARSIYSDSAHNDKKSANNISPQSSFQAGPVCAAITPALLEEKSKKRKPIKEAEQDSTAVILASAKLTPAIVLVWQTKVWGNIVVQLGKPTKNIYPLWSRIAAINAACKFYFIYFPVAQLKREYDDGMINKCRQILEFGRVVAAVGRPGILRESDESLKIKMFGSGKGVNVTGKPAEHRFSLFCLRHPADLSAPPPRVGENVYQLYAPDQLRKTH